MNMYYALKSKNGYVLMFNPLTFTTQIDHALLVTEDKLKQYKEYKAVKYISLDNPTIKY